MIHEKTGLDWSQSPEKRAMDLTFVAAAAPVAIPALAVAGAAVGVSDRVSPGFSQERLGLGLEPFTMHKIRTMPGETADTVSPGYDDPRASRIGKMLRKLHLDELPQGFQIAQGKMTLVGPRPLLPVEFEATMDELSPSERQDWIYARSVNKPGIVFTYNVQQHTSEGKLSYRSRAGHDIEYLETASFRADVSMMAESFLYTKADFLGIDLSRRPGHPQSVEAFANIAGSFGVMVEDEDKNYWKNAITICRAFDTLIDSGHEDEVPKLISEVIQGMPIPGVDKLEAEEFSRLFERLSPERRSHFFAAARSADIARSIRNVNSAPELVAHRTEESMLFAKIMSLEERGSDTIQRRDFNQWLSRFTKAGYLLDSVVDLSSDVKSNTVNLKPGVNTRLRLGLEAIKAAAEALRPVGVPTVREIAKAGLTKSLREAVGACSPKA